MTASPTQFGVSLVYHDDWLVNVLLSDGRVYTFNTECWEEWLDAKTEDNWKPVIARAERSAMFLASREVRTWGLDAIPNTVEQFKQAMNLVCQFTSDADFRAFIH